MKHIKSDKAAEPVQSNSETRATDPSAQTTLHTLPDRRNFIKTSLTALAALVATPHLLHGEEKKVAGIAEGTKVGNKMPDIELPNLEGKLAKLSSLYSGNLLLVEFWGSFCGPCKAYLSDFLELRGEFHDRHFKTESGPDLGPGFKILGISVDEERDDWLGAIKKHKLECNFHLWDRGGILTEERYGFVGVPKNLLLDSRGVIVASDFNEAMLKKTLQAMIPPEPKE